MIVSVLSIILATAGPATQRSKADAVVVANGSGDFKTIQAAIAAVHAEAAEARDTDWPQIAGLYDVLMRIDPSPVVALNRAAAIAMRDGPAAGLELIDAILSSGELNEYQLAHSARADLCRRLGRTADARSSYQRALELASAEPARRFLERRLQELETKDTK